MQKTIKIIKSNILALVPFAVVLIFFLVLFTNSTEYMNPKLVLFSFIPLTLSTWVFFAYLTKDKILTCSILILLVNITLLVYNEVITLAFNIHIPYDILLIILVVGLAMMTVGIKSVVNSMNDNFRLIEKLAYTDELTELPNRRKLYEKDELLNDEDKSLKAFYILDVDNFKQLNDTHGHEFGDLVLKYIASEIRRLLPDEAEFGRLGGDEFYIIFEKCGMDCVNKLGLLITNHFNQVHVIGKVSTVVTLTLGVSLYPRDGITVSQLMQKSDLALYNQKKVNKGGFSLYSTELELLRHSHNLQVDIINGIANSEFLVYYQPVISLMNSTVVSYEALIRWKKGDHMISPLDFLEIAEHYGQVTSIDLYMIKKVCKDYEKLNHSEIRYVSINLSSRTISRANIVTEIIDIIEKYPVPKQFINFEITETALIDNEPETVKNINKLRSYGITVSLDDFCTGYSSLNQLIIVDVDIIKIDKSFVDGIGNNIKKELIIKNIVKIAVELGIEVVGEGVEEEHQAEFLKSVGCVKGQGYYWGKPSPIEVCKLKYK